MAVFVLAEAQPRTADLHRSKECIRKRVLVRERVFFSVKLSVLQQIQKEVYVIEGGTQIRRFPQITPVDSSISDGV